MSRNIWKFLLTELIILGLVIIAVIINTSSNLEKYENNLLDNNAIIINSLIKKHPELKDDIITILLSGNKDTNRKILEQYGLTEEFLAFSQTHNNFKKDIIITNTIVITISLFLLIITFVIYYIYDCRKIKKISSYMNQLLNDNYSMDIVDYNEGDMSNLKNDIYKVTVKLKEQSDISRKDKLALEETLSDISHQLRTPLTSMYVINDVLKKDLPIKTRKEFLSKNYNQLERIEWLVTSLLKIARLDSGTVKLDIKKINVIDLIDKSIEPLKILIELKKIDLEINCDTSIKISADLNWTKEALINIIKNAIEHVANTGKITIDVIDNPIYTEILIIDNGEGIKVEDINHIFERFYKASPNKESIGIGLNMAKKIIDLEKGDISVKSKIKEGTTFSLKFYKSII